MRHCREGYKRGRLEILIERREEDRVDVVETGTSESGQEGKIAQVYKRIKGCKTFEKQLGAEG